MKIPRTPEVYANLFIFFAIVCLDTLYALKSILSCKDATGFNLSLCLQIPAPEENVELKIGCKVSDF